MGTKKCIGCKKDLPLDCFSKDRARCNICRMEKQQAENDVTRRSANYHGRPWSKADEVYLLEHRQERAADLSKHLGRTIRAIQCRRRELLDKAKLTGKPVSVDDVTEYLHVTSATITQITVNVQPPKLVVFSPTDIPPTDVEDAFREQDVSLDLYIKWLLNKRRLNGDTRTEDVDQVPELRAAGVLLSYDNA